MTDWIWAQGFDWIIVDRSDKVDALLRKQGMRNVGRLLKD
jgi:hypothetical protein